MKIEDIIIGEKYKVFSKSSDFYNKIGICKGKFSDNGIFLDFGNGVDILFHINFLIEINSIHQKALHHYGAKSQINMLIEEMAELMQAISKERRELEHNIPEEIADVQIVLDQIKLLYPEWKTWEQIKLKRLEEGL